MAATPESLTEKLDSLYSTTWQIMRSKVVDNIFNATPLWYWLNSKGRKRGETGGRWIGAQLLYGKNTTVDTIGRGGAVAITDDELITTARFDWKWLIANVIRYYADDQMNTGKNAMMNLVQAKLKTAELSMIDKLETMAFGDGTGNGGKDFMGLQGMVKASFSGDTLGGIDANTNTWWQNKYKDCTGGSGDTIAEIKSGLLNIYNTCSIGNDHPTLIMGYQAFYEWYETYCVQSILRVYETSLGDIGFEALKYKGAALTFSPSAPDAKVYLLNERYMEFVYDTNADFFMTEWKPIPNQLDRVAQIVVQGNLICNNRRMQGLMGTPAAASLPIT
jgi:hypothetical protein